MLRGCPVVLNLVSSKYKEEKTCKPEPHVSFLLSANNPPTPAPTPIHLVSPLWKYLEGSEVSKFTAVGATSESESFDPSMTLVFKKLISNQGIYFGGRLFDHRLLNGLVLSFMRGKKGNSFRGNFVLT